MTDLQKRIGEAVAAIRAKTSLVPDFGVILGTGLGGLAADIEREAVISYEAIPHFARATAVGHKGDLVLGRLAGRPVAAMEGRFHYYEGYTLDQITFPVRVLRALGARVLVVSCACGGMNPSYAKGDLVLIDDHINLMGANPLVGPNDDTLGPRFPDMCAPYDKSLLELALKAAKDLGISARVGVYAALTGPCLETRAEYRMLRVMGADIVGMSTVPEVIVGVHAGLRILGVGVVTDLCLPDDLRPANIAEIIATANAAGPKLAALLKCVIGQAVP